MRKNIEEAWGAFVSGRKYTGSRGTLNVHDGILHSYRMPIAWRNAAGEVVLTSEPSPSVTTSRHINAVRRLMKK